jgi:hypothetical protein
MNEFKVKTKNEELWKANINRAIEEAARTETTEISHSLLKKLRSKASSITSGLSASNEEWKAEIKMALEKANMALVELRYEIDYRKGDKHVLLGANEPQKEIAGKTVWTMEFNVGAAYLRFDGNKWARLPYPFSASYSGDRAMTYVLFSSSEGLIYDYSRKTKTVLHDVTNKKILKILDGFDYKQLLKTEKELFGKEVEYHGSLGWWLFFHKTEK